MLQVGMSWVKLPMRSLEICTVSNSSSPNITAGFTQSLAENSTRNVPGGKVRPELKVDKLTAICEPIVW
jgi:hypothetical protein